MGSSTAQEYNKILKLLKDDQITNQDVYTELMKLESNVLNTASRVAESKLHDDIKSMLTFDQSFPSLIARTANMWSTMVMDLFRVEKATEIANVFLKGSRKIYFGILLACVGLFIFFIDISS
jgi:hypothetical protein